MIYISTDTAQFDAESFKELKAMIGFHKQGASSEDLLDLLNKCRSLTADFFHVPVESETYKRDVKVDGKVVGTMICRKGGLMDWVEDESQRMTVDTHFGVCPLCHTTDGFINVGREHWFHCAEHKVKWCAGSNLFSGWKTQTEEQQQAIYNRLRFEEFTVVQPFYGVR